MPIPSLHSASGMWQNPRWSTTSPSSLPLLTSEYANRADLWNRADQNFLNFFLFKSCRFLVCLWLSVVVSSHKGGVLFPRRQFKCCRETPIFLRMFSKFHDQVSVESQVTSLIAHKHGSNYHNYYNELMNNE